MKLLLFTLLIFLSLSIILLLDKKLKKREMKINSRKKNKKLPIQIIVNKTVKNYKKDVIKAINYINSSTKQEIFTLKKSFSKTHVVHESDVLVPIDLTNPTMTVAFSVADADFISLQQNFKLMEEEIRFILIAHELLHDLGFEHQEASVLSILNEGSVLLNKIYSNPLILIQLTKQLPQHDIDMIKNQYF